MPEEDCFVDRMGHIYVRRRPNHMRYTRFISEVKAWAEQDNFWAVSMLRDMREIRIITRAEARKMIESAGGAW
jgi:hypothetical protein